MNSCMLFGVGVRVSVSSEGRSECEDYSNLCDTPAVVVSLSLWLNLRIIPQIRPRPFISISFTVLYWSCSV